MYKQSPSRNYRSKGIKVKHILQICVLLAVCLWLIYQVKHSHEKRREFEGKGEKVVGKIRSDGEIQRFGRKDIPKILESAKDGEKHEEEDEEEKEGEDEENKHEEDELEREDVRVVDREEEREGGDDEIDEHEPEKTETESEHEEEAVDKEKEREDKEGGTEEKHSENEETEDVHEEGHHVEDEIEDIGKEGHIKPEEIDDVDNEDRNEQDIILSDQDHVGSRTNTREAQEELYKADDASSEVAQTVQSIIPETENVTTGHGNEMWGKVNFGQEHETKTFDKSDELIKPEVQPRDDVNSVSSNTTITEQENNDVNLTKPDDSSLQNSTLPEITTNSTVGGTHSATLFSNETQTALDSTLNHNGTGEVSGNKEPNMAGNELEHTVKLEQATNNKNQEEATVGAKKDENVNTGTGESSTSHDTSLASSHATNDHDAIEVTKDSSVDNENQDEKQENSGKSGLDENSEAHSDEGTDIIQHDPIDASDTTTLTQEERESRTDLGTLPEIRTEIQNNEDAAAE